MLIDSSSLTPTAACREATIDSNLSSRVWAKVFFFDKVRSQLKPMKIKRRQFLAFMGTAAAVSACKVPQQNPPASSPPPSQALAFQPVHPPLPLEISHVPVAQQPEAYRTYDVMDDLVLPEGYTYDVIAAWGDPVGDSRYGYNNDYVSLCGNGSPDWGPHD